MPTGSGAVSTFVPFVRMRERLRRSADDSDTAYFYDVLSAGEQVVKVTVAGLVAAMRRDPTGHQYRLESTLVRADGIGDWVNVLDELLTGPASEQVDGDAQDAQRQLTQTLVGSDWPRNVLDLSEGAASFVGPNRPGFKKAQLRQWFTTFAWIRNKTRGHGAPDLEQCANIAAPLGDSVFMLMDRLLVSQWPWAVIRRGISGRYRVTQLGNGTASSLQELTRRPDLAYDDGVYVGLNRPVHVRLAISDVDVSDFFLSNGAFTPTTYEVLSYPSGERKLVPSASYLKPPAPLPASETRSAASVGVRKNVLSNMPPPPIGYVSRLALEQELRGLLLDDRRPVITIGGRGGIGKTFLALTVLDQIADDARFDNIWWFSSRDIDLLPVGPKQVQPDVVNADDIARTFASLTALEAEAAKPPALASATVNLVNWLSGATRAGASLFVFDNFETVDSPADVYRWLEDSIRLPNKILITTRVRSFKGDWPVDVGGMTEDEFTKLVATVSRQLGIEAIISDTYQHEIFHQSDGHPYVARILLGEVARTGRPASVERIMGSHEEILTALFERTFTISLSPAAQRVFLTLCGWRSLVAELALQAALLRPGNERIDVTSAIDELIRSSMVEAMEAPGGDRFLFVPLAAQLFGRSKLTVAAAKPAIESDLTILRAFGAAQDTDVRRGLQPRIDAVTRVAHEQFDDIRPILEYVATHYAPAWLNLADLHFQRGDRRAEANALAQYASMKPADPAGWRRLATAEAALGEAEAQMNALLQLAELPATPYREISNAADTFNRHHASHRLSTDSLEKRLVAERLRTLLESRLAEADATDLSRLGWVCMHLQDSISAKEYARRGLAIDSGNAFCRRLLAAN
jgi:hypothetical protein